MSNIHWAQAAAAKAYAKSEYEKEMVGGGAPAGPDADLCGPPHWNRDSWERFRTQWGFYPFGWQNGTRIMPPTFAGAPDWVYDLMDMRKPPVTVTPGQDNSR